jgi:hypothetical protein
LAFCVAAGCRDRGVRTEMSLHVPANILKRVMRILGMGETLAAIRAWSQVGVAGRVVLTRRLRRQLGRRRHRWNAACSII